MGERKINIRVQFVIEKLVDIINEQNGDVIEDLLDESEIQEINDAIREIGVDAQIGQVEALVGSIEDHLDFLCGWRYVN